ncbi:hypothetical protein CW714_02680 [Methanophagales archaeon]|nr:MAG: hypothetical protein CW714_02680 [Methanophagales archaeon]
MKEAACASCAGNQNHPKVLYLHHTKEVMKRAMRKTIIIAGAAICIICAAVISYAVIERGGRDAIPSQDLTLSDYPKLFEKEAVIVIGENASQIEKESAEAIAANLENLTGNKPEIISSKKIESFKYTYNLIIIGMPKTNPFLEEVHAMTNATRVTEEFPGEGEGVLEILPNPWDESKAMLLVEGSDEWGVKAGGEIIEQTQELNEANIVVGWKESGAVIVKEPPLGQVMSAGKHYPSEPFRIEKYNASEVIEKAKETDHWIRQGSRYGPPYTYYNGSTSKELYVYEEGYIVLKIDQESYTLLLDPENIDNPTNNIYVLLFAPKKDIPLATAREIVENELLEIGINLEYIEKIEWDLNKGFVPPKTELENEGGI